MKSYPAVIKWSGSKRPVAKQLATYITYGETYFEPFLGGGAMMPYSQSKIGMASDIIPELIDLWNAIKTEPLIVAEEYKTRWSALQSRGPEVYYEVRDSFNATRNCFDFLFLTRTCVNGLIRYNTNGEFNNSFHLSRPGINPDSLRRILEQWSVAIAKFTFVLCDYRELLTRAKKGDFVFLDPPYGGTKDRYTRTPFDLNEFYLELDRLNSKGVKWMLTFDGEAGDRQYSYSPPPDLFTQKFSIHTGNSAFTKVMNSQKDSIQESVYLNFESSHDLFGLF